MEATSLWTYPGTWIGLGVMVVLVGGLVIFAVTLRRTLRQPPIDQPPHTNTSATPRTDSESNPKP